MGWGKWEKKTRQRDVDELKSRAIKKPSVHPTILSVLLCVLCCAFVPSCSLGQHRTDLSRCRLKFQNLGRGTQRPAPKVPSQPGLCQEVVVALICFFGNGSWALGGRACKATSPSPEDCDDKRYQG